MTNCVKTDKRNKQGFSLAEVLVTVALLVILMGLATIEVPRYLRSMKQLERDGIAKEIFVAAQNNLSQISGQGYLQKNYPGIAESGSQEIYYYVVGTDSSCDSLESVNSTLPTMLPSQSIDETVRSGGSYVIRYQKSAGLVLDVFYCEPGGRFGRSFKKSDYDFLKGVRGDAMKKERRFFGTEKLVVGYYGGVDPAPAIITAELKAPELIIENAEKLIVTVKPQEQETVIAGQVRYRLIIRGESSGAVWSSDLGSLSTAYDLILDDITTTGKHFSTVSSGTGLIPGENLILKAQAYIAESGTDVRVSESKEEKTNSLFAELTGSEVKISNLRHLENLGEDISGFTGTLNGSSVTSAAQTTDMSWDAFSEAIGGSTVKIYYADGASSVDNCFLPVNPKEALSYDGGNFTISGLKVNLTAGDAGLFGQMQDGSAIQNLRLVDFTVSTGNGNAGALAGSLVNTDVSGVLCYNDITTGSSDAAFEITAAGTGTSGNAGGLIGSMSGGSVDGCAAAVYVKASNAAGGLIGSAEFLEAITSSYSGGHTDNARYQQGETGKARINVQGSVAAGGLVGKVAGPSTGTTIRYCYSTSSVITSDSGTAGGFIGVLSKASVSDCYTTAYVKNQGTVQTFVGTGKNSASCSFGGKLYYLTNLSPKVDNDITRVEGVSGKDTGMPDFIFVGDAESKRQPAYIYDDTLKVDYGGKFYFPTVEQLQGTAYTGKKYAGITNMQYGDWQVPFLDTLEFYFVNEDQLYLKINPGNLADKKYFIISLTGDTSSTGMTASTDKSVFYLIKADNLENPQIIDQGHMVNEAGADKIQWAEGVVANPLPISYNTTDGYIYIILDDITTAGHHFSTLFSGTGLIPGENITARLVLGNSVGVNEIFEVGGAKENSLFALGTNGEGLPDIKSGIDSHTAVIRYSRHLENLDTSISNVDGRITAAFLNNDITWDGSKYPQITDASAVGTVLVEGGFYGICNSYLLDFDGNELSLIGFPFKSSTSGTYAGNAGLFRYVQPYSFEGIATEFDIHELELLNCSATSVNGHAGMVIAQTGRGNGSNVPPVRVDTVFVHHNNAVNPSDGMVTATESGSAGGLIGYASSGCGFTVVENSSASVLVKAVGAAGGLIGSVVDDGTANIIRCYSGGHTKNGKYEVSSPEVYNIQSTANDAGGLIGYVCGPTTIMQSFSAASVSSTGDKYNYAAGGIIGTSRKAVTLDQVYTIAPVYGVSYESGGSSTGGSSGGASLKTAPLKASTPVTGPSSDPSLVMLGSGLSTPVTVPSGPAADTNLLLKGTEDVVMLGASAGSADVTAGAIIGRTDVEITNVTYSGSGSVFFLPEIYVGGEDMNRLETVEAIGSGSISAEPLFAYYQRNEQSILISAKDHVTTMQNRTVPYDSVLLTNRYGSDREYPFSIWTSFPKVDTEADEWNGYYDGVYYGDWEPVELIPTDPGTITFTYIDPNTGIEMDINSNLAVQNIRLGEENRVLVPYVPLYDGYVFDSWEIGGTAYHDEQGFLKLSEDICSESLTARGQYTATTITGYLVRFLYDENVTSTEDGTTPSFKQLDKAKFISKTSLLSSVGVPEMSIDGYYLEGWYSDQEFTNSVDLSKTQAQTLSGLVDDKNYLSLYAHYVPLEYFTVTIDFMYAYDGSYKHLLSVPRYSLDDTAQYRLKYLKGRIVDEDVALPVFPPEEEMVFLEMTDYDNNNLGSDGGSGIAVYSNAGGVEKVHLSNIRSDCHLIAVYKAKTISELYPYKIQYVLHNTTESGGISSNYDDTLTFDPYAAYASQHAAEFKAQLGSTPAVRGYDPETMSGIVTLPASVGDLSGFELTKIDSNPIANPAVTGQENIIKIHYSRKKFRIDFQPLGGTYFAPKQFFYGETIQGYDTVPTRDGYQFDSTKAGTTSGWTILPFAESFNPDSAVSTKYYWNSSTMPGENLKAWPNWKAKEVNYNIVYWLQNANDNEYSYLGAETKKAMAGTKLQFGESDFFSHTHSLACFDGVGDKIYHEAQVVVQNGIKVGNTFIEGTWNTAGTTFTATGGKVYNVYPKLQMWYWNNWQDVTRTANTDDPASQTYAYGKTPITLRENGKWYYDGGERSKQDKNNTFEIYYNGSWTTELTKSASQTVVIWSDTYQNKEVIIKKADGTQLSGNSMSPTGYSQANGTIANWTAVDNSVSGKCICWNGVWCNYTGSATAGTTLRCTKAANNTPTFTVPYKTGDSSKYYYFDHCDEATVQSDNSTVVNVYLNRKHYTVRFEIGFWDDSAKTFKIKRQDESNAWESYANFFTSGTKDVGNTLPFNVKTLYDYNVDGSLNTAAKEDVVRKGYLGVVRDNNKDYMTICIDLTARYGQAISDDHAWVGNHQGLTGKDNNIYCGGGWSFVQWYLEGRGVSKATDLPTGDTAHASIKGNKGSMSKAVITVSDSGRKNENCIAVEDNPSQPTVELRSRCKEQENVIIYANHFPGIDGSDVILCAGPFYGGSHACEQLPSEFEGFKKITLSSTQTNRNNNGTYPQKWDKSKPANQLNLANERRYWSGKNYVDKNNKQLKTDDLNTCEPQAVIDYVNTLSSSGKLVWPSSFTDDGFYIVHFVYERETYNLDYFVDGTKVSTATKQYEASLADQSSYIPARPAGTPADYTFDGWYQSAECTGEKYNLSNHTMPASNMVLYGRWVAPSYEVTFALNDPAPERGAAANFVTQAVPVDAGKDMNANVHYVKNGENYDPYSFIVRSGSNISELMTDTKGFDFPAYTAQKKDGTSANKDLYDFVQWKYYNPDTETKEQGHDFVSSTPITGKTVIFAVWQEHMESGGMAGITVYDYYDMEDHIRDMGGAKYPVGTVLTVEALDLNEYYAKTTMQKVVVQEEESKNVVKFYYEKIKEWKYDVEYYVTYRDYASLETVDKTSLNAAYTTDANAGTEGVTVFNSGSASYLVSTLTNQVAMNQYEPVEFHLPEGFVAYHLVSVNANGTSKTTSDPHATLPRNMSTEGNVRNVIQFYLEPDADVFAITDRTTVYNGTSAAIYEENVTEELRKNKDLVFPNTVNGRAVNYYRYKDINGNDTSGIIVDSGAYSMNGYSTLVITGTAQGESEVTTKRFLMWKENHAGLNLRVQPRNITLISASAEKIGSGGALTASQYVIPMTGYAGISIPKDATRFETDTTLKNLRKKYPMIENYQGQAAWYNDASDILLIGPDDGKPPLIANDITNGSLKVNFSVEAFRSGPGSSDNSFVYETTGDLKKKTEEDYDYQFNTIFGTLTVR